MVLECVVSDMYDEELSTIPTGPLKFEQIDGSCMGYPASDNEGNYNLEQLDGMYELAIIAQHVDKVTGEVDNENAHLAYSTVKFSSLNVDDPGDGDPGDGDPGDGDPGNGDPGTDDPGTAIRAPAVRAEVLAARMAATAATRLRQASSRRRS